MTVGELLTACTTDARHRQLHINAFVDEFRAAAAGRRTAMIATAPQQPGTIAGLIAAVVSALCREVHMQPPEWVAHVRSPEPFFVFPARGFALRLRLMLESPPPFRARNVFVPENYLSRA